MGSLAGAYQRVFHAEVPRSNAAHVCHPDVEIKLFQSFFNNLPKPVEVSVPWNMRRVRVDYRHKAFPAIDNGSNNPDRPHERRCRNHMSTFATVILLIETVYDTQLRTSLPILN